MFKLKPFQKQALQHLQAPSHVICVAATGSGKSLVYERATQLYGFRTLLFTPLVALGRQQKANIQNLGLGESEIRIMSPEKLFEPDKQKPLSELKNWRPDFLVVDECHCLWEWGEDFRPAFLQIPRVFELFKMKRSLWLTATLTPHDRAELRTLLQGPVHEVGGFSLPKKLYLELRQIALPWRVEFLCDWVKKNPGPGIVFVSSRAMTHRLEKLFGIMGKRTLTYHAGMSSEERLNAEALIKSGQIEVVFATSAFGMGMDIDVLKWVVIWQAPYSLLGLAQAIGRVGRAGSEGRALILWDWDDFSLIEWSLGKSYRRRRSLQSVLSYFEYKGCRRHALERYFEAELSPQPCGYCDFCNDGLNEGHENNYRVLRLSSS